MYFSPRWEEEQGEFVNIEHSWELKFIQGKSKLHPWLKSVEGLVLVQCDHWSNGISIF